MSNTDFGALAHGAGVKKARYWVSKTWAVLMVIVLPGWGAFTAGYWLGVSDERDRGGEELSRLQTAYGQQLSSLAGKTERAAAATSEAATALANTSETVELVANQVATQAAAKQPVKPASPGAAGARGPSTP
ncbi:hypothetical protein [Comamonas odontotermitis]|uniref:hypothetical protein n=1 Tax=Comamonas odontotermitis TaxID=379895 RepID=UPI001CC43FE5|nr:hypothetical protein [Comamonas odontotermitis]UBB19537.1 hypothetical protein LAD35_22040 [Comamonas odontotermitis]